jgi:hypothetical protein
MKIKLLIIIIDLQSDREINQIADIESITGQSFVNYRHFPSFVKSENGINRREIKNNLLSMKRFFMKMTGNILILTVW